MQSPNGFLYMTANGAKNTDGKHAFLFRVIINKVGATANTLTLSDTVTGVAFAVIDTTVLSQRDYGGLRIPGGITATLATGTAADVTIVYG